MTPTVVSIGQEDTFALRRAVLRNGDAAADVAWDEDTWPGTVHLGVRIGGELVGTSTWIPRAMPGADDGDDFVWQLRGMATANGRRGGGLGGILVEAGCQRCAGAGGRLVWARARDAALAFYAAHDFQVVGEGFVDATTQLPHHLVRRTVG